MRKLTLGGGASGTYRTMRWFTILAAAVVAALMWVGVVRAATEVPKITNLRAEPARFCAKKSSTCAHPGTTVKFRISSRARVRCDIRPRFENVPGYVEFVRRLPRGANAVRIDDPRLTKGRWTIRVQGTNNVGSGGIAITDVHVVKGA